jgi:dihydroorotase
LDEARAAGEIDDLAAGFEPLMTLYLTDNTGAQDILEAKASGLVHAVKLYPAGATTNSDAGVSDMARVRPALEAMQSVGLPLLVHGEVTDPQVDLFDREQVFIDRVMLPLRRDFPALKVVFEHITTLQAAQYVAQAGELTAATITAHHLLYNRNALFLGGVRPHWYCLPVLKRETHRQALVQAATRGGAQFFLGTDSAPHARHLKEHACGCAGCYTAPHALELYAAAFEAAGALARLKPRQPEWSTLLRPAGQRGPGKLPTAWQIPDSLPFDGESIVLAAGESLAWQMVAGDADIRGAVVCAARPAAGGARPAGPGR